MAEETFGNGEPTPCRITVYADEGGRWRWRLRLGNGRKFAVSGESFASRRNARRAADRMAELVYVGAPIDVVEEG